jgi:hypothetical protein
LARAKNTDRAEARRRHREQTRSAATLDPDLEDSIAAADAVAQATDMPAPRMGFRMPDVRADLAILPGMLLHTKKLWIPFALLLASFVAGLLLANRAFPEGIDRTVGLFVELTLPPTSLFVFFIGGFLAPRASYLVGGLLGLVDGILWSLLFVLAPGAQPNDPSRPGGTAAVAPTPLDYLSIIAIAVVVGILAAGFAAWYRNFLRQSQERARANRAAREQQARAKAKETERQAREDQRKAAAAARQAGKTTPTSTGPNTGVPPT